MSIKIEWLRPYLLTKKEQEKLVMLEFRSLALFFGFDISDMSDADIKEGLYKATKEMSKVGISASEACGAFRRMFLALA